VFVCLYKFIFNCCKAGKNAVATETFVSLFAGTVTGIDVHCVPQVIFTIVNIVQGLAQMLW